MLELFRSGEFTTPLYDAASRDPWKAPFLFDVFTSDLQNASGKPSDLLNIGTRYVGIGSRRTLIGDPIAAAREAAKNPAKVLKSNHGFEAVPAPVLQAAALIVATAKQSHALYQLFWNSIADEDAADPKKWLSTLETALKDDSTPDDFAGALTLFRRADTRYLVAGGHDLTLAVQEAAALIKDVSPDLSYNVEIQTDFGVVQLSGGHDSMYREDPERFLTIDTGGNDTYVNAPSSRGGRNWAQIVIDSRGNDKYVSDQALTDMPVSAFPARKGSGLVPGPAGAVLGYSLLFDLAGNDIYRSARCGLASGRLGVAVIEDTEGDDRYDGYMDSLGFGMFGAGILEDLGGNDTYSGFTQVEAVGQTAGFGAIVDRAGNDSYVANDDVIDFPSAQSEKHNNSMAQGAGNGTRRDYLDAHSLAGGIGVLLDVAGNDRYSGAVFAQGVGYLEGVGILRDLGGNDSYDAGWYAQGASAHFAVGYLRDDTGDDSYNASMNMAQGAGHDFGAGYLLDLSGADRYVAPNLSLGAGNANGIGLFLDASGNDSYTSSGITLGQSGESPKGSLRERALCLGVFMDIGGSDTYPTSLLWAKNGSAQVNWTGRSRVPEESQLGIFLDR